MEYLVTITWDNEDRASFQIRLATEAAVAALVKASLAQASLIRIEVV